MKLRYHFLFVVAAVVAAVICLSPGLWAEAIAPLPHQPPPTITGNEPGAQTTIGGDGSVTTTVTRTSSEYPQQGSSTTTTVQETVTIQPDGTSVTNVTTTVEAKTDREVDQDGTLDKTTTTTTTSTTQTTDPNGNTVTETTQSGTEHFEHIPAASPGELEYEDETEDTTDRPKITRKTDSEGNETRSVEDGDTRTTTTTRPATGETVTTVEGRTWDDDTGTSDFEVKSQTTSRPNGTSTEWRQNDDGSTSTIDKAKDGSYTKHTRHKDGRQEIEKRDKDGYTEKTEYDKDGKVTKKTKYDKDGNPILEEIWNRDGTKKETSFYKGKKWRTVTFDKKGKPTDVFFWHKAFEDPWGPMGQAVRGGTERLAETGDATSIFDASFGGLQSSTMGTVPDDTIFDTFDALQSDFGVFGGRPRPQSRDIQSAGGAPSTLEHPKSDS